MKLYKKQNTYLGRCFIFTKFLKNLKIPLDFCYKRIYNIDIKNDIKFENKRKEEEMLKKKGFVQKTFRLDCNVNEDFETLSEILERTQNDLANVAIEELINDNKYWIAKNILVDYASDFFYQYEDTIFEVCGMHVELKEIKEDIFYLKIVQKDANGVIIQQIEKEYNAIEDKEYDKKIIKELRYFGSLIDYNAKEVQEYLREKLNYK